MSDTAIQNIKDLANKIQYISSNMEIKCKNNIIDYKLRDIQNIDKLIKKCKSCNEYFIPNYFYKNHQIYCSSTCRNKTIKENKYQLRLDERQRPIDLLRKTIYERRYRALRDSKTINNKYYELLLTKLKALNKDRWKYEKSEFTNILEDLHAEYLEIVAIEKGIIKKDE